MQEKQIEGQKRGRRQRKTKWQKSESSLLSGYFFFFQSPISFKRAKHKNTPIWQRHGETGIFTSWFSQCTFVQPIGRAVWQDDLRAIKHAQWTALRNVPKRKNSEYTFQKLNVQGIYFSFSTIEKNERHMSDIEIILNNSVYANLMGYHAAVKILNFNGEKHG